MACREPMLLPPQQEHRRKTTVGRTCCPTKTGGRPNHLPMAPPPPPSCPDQSPDSVTPATRRRSCTLALRAGLLHACGSRPRAPLNEENAERAAASAQLVRQRARPRRRTGQRNCPRAPNPPVEAPHQMLGRLHTPASTMLARVISLCRSVVSSTSTLSSMAPPTPSLHRPVWLSG